jgi:hypothetical protein
MAITHRQSVMTITHRQSVMIINHRQSVKSTIPGRVGRVRCIGPQTALAIPAHNCTVRPRRRRTIQAECSSRDGRSHAPQSRAAVRPSVTCMTAQSAGALRASHVSPSPTTLPSLTQAYAARLPRFPPPSSRIATVPSTPPLYAARLPRVATAPSPTPSSLVPCIFHTFNPPAPLPPAAGPRCSPTPSSPSQAAAPPPLLPARSSPPAGRPASGPATAAGRRPRSPAGHTLSLLEPLSRATLEPLSTRHPQPLEPQFTRHPQPVPGARRPGSTRGTVESSPDGPLSPPRGSVESS